MVRGTQRVEECIERLIAALQLLPLHGKRRVEQSDDRLWGAVRCIAARRSISEERFRFEETRLICAANGGSLGWRGLTTYRISIGQQLHGVGRRWIEFVGREEIFGEVYVLPVKMTGYEMRGVLVELHGKRLGGSLKIADRVRRVQFKVDAEMSRHLGRVRVRSQGNRKIGLQVLDRDGLVIFDLEPLGAEGRNRNNF